MLTDEEIIEEVSRLDRIWENPNNRNDVFGNTLKAIEVTGIRGLNTSIEFSWPVVAIAGVNGTGKTTLLQIASTAYSRSVGGRYFKLGEWIRNELRGDTPPVARDARVTYSFWDNSPTIPVPYESGNSRWRYPRRGNPQRHVEFIGVANFAPRIERKDRVHVFRTQLEIRASEDLPVEMLQSFTAVSGRAYTGGSIHTVGSPNGHWTERLPQVARDGVIYSEPHMGAGEQKVIRLIRQLEGLPRQSLVVLEEPELTLHPDAQRGLAWYLMNLSRRRGHQILIATHSADIFETVPQAARVLLVRGPAGAVQVVHRAKYLSAARELVANVRLNKDLVLVEDIVAQHLLAEILRQFSRPLLDHCTIVPVGSANDVRRLVESFRSAGVRVVGVRDGDMGADQLNNMLSLPGNLSPEELLLSPENVGRTERWINGFRDVFAQAEVTALGTRGAVRAKRIMSVLPLKSGLSEEVLADRLCIAWLSANEAAARQLAADITALFEAQEHR
ncbi:ATP-dependent nuclease [Trinickia mobilis]|uniref:ATP-dependent nuclease n=1 Tax=Trinickia mobilis TaxID=2816356 RepID=UPI001A8BFEE8|nr:AAA family ATPase [Trinickia mobilis]